jgi:hypothetical protein
METASVRVVAFDLPRTKPLCDLTLFHLEDDWHLSSGIPGFTVTR